MRGRRFASWPAALVAAAVAAALALASCAGGDGTASRLGTSIAAATPAATWVTGTPGVATGNDDAAASTASASASTTTPAPTAAAALPTATASRGGMPGMRGGMGMMGSPQAAPTASPSTAAPAPTATSATGATPAPLTSAAIYQQNCAVCHGISRQGGKGPALLPADVTDTSYATRVIEYGVVGTLMPGWLANGLTPGQITALVDYLRTTP